MWRRLRKMIEELIIKRKEKYAISQKDALLAKGGERNFLKT